MRTQLHMLYLSEFLFIDMLTFVGKFVFLYNFALPP